MKSLAIAAVAAAALAMPAFAQDAGKDDDDATAEELALEAEGEEWKSDDEADAHADHGDHGDHSGDEAADDMDWGEDEGAEPEL